MRKKIVPLLLATALLVPSMAQAASEDQENVTRGQFFHMVTEHLQWPDQSREAALPEDIAADSAYAESVRQLIGQKVVFGFPDGTVGADRALTGNEATLILGRLLGLDDAEAATFLQTVYGVSFADDAVSAEAAEQAVQTVLISDADAVELMKASYEEQLAVDSFRSEINQQTTVAMKEDGAIPGMPSSVELPMTSVMEYHKDQGLRQTVTMNLSGIAGAEAVGSEMKMEQYIVPEGMYMMTTDPSTGEEMWLNMGSMLPVSFDQMMAMQNSNLNMNDAFTDKYIFYRYDGEQTVDGQTLHQISYNGHLASLEHILQMLKSLMPDENQAAELLAGLEETMDVSMNFTGTMWIEAESKLPVKTDMDVRMAFGEVEGMPIDHMKMSMEMDFYDYGKVEGIVLPEAAKNAEPLPTLTDEGAAEEVTDEASEEVTEEISEEVTEDVSEEVSEEAAADNADN